MILAFFSHALCDRMECQQTRGKRASIHQGMFAAETCGISITLPYCACRQLLLLLGWNESGSCGGSWQERGHRPAALTTVSVDGRTGWLQAPVGELSHLPWSVHRGRGATCRAGPSWLSFWSKQTVLEDMEGFATAGSADTGTFHVGGNNDTRGTESCLWCLAQCGHLHHGTCLLEWLRIRATCPLCSCGIYLFCKKKIM